MARPIPCDNGDGNQGVYVITDLADGSTFAVCAGCWIALCAQVAQAAGALPTEDAPATTPQPIDPPVDPSDPDNDVLVSDVAEVSTVDRDGTEVVWPHHPDDDAAAQQQRVHADLAARPDSTPTSESVTWNLEGIHRADDA